MASPWFASSDDIQEDENAAMMATCLDNERQFPAILNLDLDLLKEWIVTLGCDFRPGELERLAPKVLSGLHSKK